MALYTRQHAVPVPAAHAVPGPVPPAPQLIAPVPSEDNKRKAGWITC
jgi:hypothetical protein